MGTADRKDPLLNYNFKVETNGTIIASFREASGLDSTQDPVEYREGGEALTARKLPGLNKYSNISLKRGVTDDVTMWEWRKKVMEGKVAEARVDGAIVLLDSTGEEKARWNFLAGWPTKWTGPSFNATANEIAIEALEIAHEGITKA